MASNEQTSLFQRAGKAALPFGGLMSVISLSMVFADRFAPLGTVAIVLLLALPFVVEHSQRKIFVAEEGMTEFAALWMHGILLFILGGLITGLVTYLVLQNTRPDFAYEQVNAMLEVYDTMPEFKDSEFVDVLRRARDNDLLPSPIEMVFNTFWLVSFTGSLLSAFTALIAQRRIK